MADFPLPGFPYDDEDEDEKTSEVLMEIQKLENILLEQLDKESTFDWHSLDDGPAATSTFDEESTLDEVASNSTLRKELNQVITPYGHVSDRVQKYEELQPARARSKFNSEDDETTTSQQESKTNQPQETLLSQTTKIKSMLENLERQLNESASQQPFSPSADIQNSIRSLHNLENSLQKTTSSSPKTRGLSPLSPEQFSVRKTLSWPDQDSPPTTTPRMSQLSSTQMDNHNRLHSTRHNLWGGTTPIRGGIQEQYDDDDENMSIASVVAVASGNPNHRRQRRPVVVEEQTCCLPNNEAAGQDTTNILPRDDYFSPAYQSSFSHAYHLDIPDPRIYHYYAPQEPSMRTENACCRVRPLERLLATLKSLEQRVASSCRGGGGGGGAVQPILHTFPEDEEFELAGLDLSNPAMMERYKEL
eukprot:scaffold265_cov131-Cylindrotheca_fusiformis.AAC.6